MLPGRRGETAAITNSWTFAQTEGTHQILTPLKIATIGSSGFLGSRVTSHGQRVGLGIVPVAGPRIAPVSSSGLGRAAGRWCRGNEAAFDALCRALAGFDVVINAAGMAGPGSADVAALWAANVVQPAVVALACQRVGVRRLVHVSTAAVQGRLDPLDETPRHAPFSPYTRSKAAAERYLLDADHERPPEVVLYRPASVHAAQRATTRVLVRLASAPVVPVVASGQQPLPFALVENVVAGILFAATSASCTPIVVQPDEGMTSRTLLELFGARHVVAVPRTAIAFGVGALRHLSAQLPSLNTFARGLELMFLGQQVAESSLTRAGFVPPAGPEAWRSLADSIRFPVDAASDLVSVTSVALDVRR